MKEINDIRPDRISVHAQKQIDSKTKFIGRINPQGGQRIFELNVMTGMVREIDESDFEAVSVKFGAGKDATPVNRKLIVKEHCLYCVAINRKNAERKFKKQLQNLINKK